MPATSTPAGHFRALVWKRSDFRETSRVITLLTPDRGRMTVLGKGAHRPGSQCLGRIDFLNLIAVKTSRGALPVLHRVRLLHEHRRLRQPARYLAACYLTELFDPAFIQGRADPELFDLLTGGLLLLERCPPGAVAQILAGLELKFLKVQGLQPPLRACSHCGRDLAGGAARLATRHPGLLCAEHAPPDAPTLPAAALEWMQVIDGSAGRAWPGLPPAPPAVRSVLGRWIGTTTEAAPRLRRAAYAAAPG